MSGQNENPMKPRIRLVSNSGDGRPQTMEVDPGTTARQLRDNLYGSKYDSENFTVEVNRTTEIDRPLVDGDTVQIYPNKADGGQFR